MVLARLVIVDIPANVLKLNLHQLFSSIYGQLIKRCSLLNIHCSFLRGLVSDVSDVGMCIWIKPDDASDLFHDIIPDRKHLFLCKTLVSLLIL